MLPPLQSLQLPLIHQWLCDFFSDTITTIRDSFSFTNKILFIRSVAYFLVKESLDILLSSITKLVNYSISEGVVSASFRKAVIPLIEQVSLPPNNLINY